MSEPTYEELTQMFQDEREKRWSLELTMTHLQEVIELYIKDEQHIQNVLQEFFEFLDYTEESDGGRMFNPITVSCCRAGMMGRLNAVLYEMKKYAEDGEKFTPPEPHLTKVYIDGSEA